MVRYLFNEKMFRLFKILITENVFIVQISAHLSGMLGTRGDPVFWTKALGLHYNPSVCLPLFKEAKCIILDLRFEIRGTIFVFCQLGNTICVFHS